MANQDRPDCKVFHVCTVCCGKYSEEVVMLNSLRYDPKLVMAGILFSGGFGEYVRYTVD